MVGNCKASNWAEKLLRKTKSILGKAPSAKVLAICLAAQASFASDARALDNNFLHSPNFGSCGINVVSSALNNFGGITVANTATTPAGFSAPAGGFWVGGLINNSVPPVSTAFLSGCVSGSSASEFTNLVQEGANGASFAAEEGMVLSFDFRGRSYLYSVTGATGTVASFTPSITDFTPPTATLGPLTLTSSGTYESNITLSEPASGNLFEQADLTVGNGVAALTGSGTSFTATITPAADGLVTLDVAAATFTDAAGNDNTAATQVSATFDGTAPTIELVTANAPGVLDVGNRLLVQLQFDESVGVTGAPQIAVNIGGTIRYLDTLSGAAPFTSIRSFFYTIQAGDNDPDGITIVSLNLNGGTLRDAAGNDLDLTLNGVSSTVGILVDTAVPTITLGPLTATGSGTYTSAITLSEPASGNLFEQADLTVGNGAATLTGSGTSFTATITPAADGLVTLDVAAAAFTDIANKGNTAATQVSATFDGTPPTITLGSLTHTGSGTLTSAITLSEPASGNLLEQSDFLVTQGSLSLTGSGTSFTATITPVSDGPIQFIAPPGAFSDAAGNLNQIPVIVATFFDGTAPTITLGPLTDTGSGTFTSAITLSEPASSNLFEVGDLRVSNGSVTLAGSGTDFTATITPTAEGFVSLNVSAGTFTDAAVNDNQAASQVATFFDPTPPTVTLGPLTATGTGTFTSTVTLSERDSIDVLELAELVVGNGTANSLVRSISLPGPRTYIATITPAGDGLLTLDVPTGSFTDFAGNDNIAATQVSVLVDTIAPTITLGPLTDTGAGTFTSAITLSEPAAGNLFEQSDLTVRNGTAALTGSGTSFTATITPAADGRVRLNVAAATFTDLTGNDNTASNGVSTRFDETAPVVTEVLVPWDGIFVVGQPLEFLVVFNELIVADVSGGTPQLAINIGGTVRQAIYLPQIATPFMHFQYIVQAGDNDDDGISIGAINPNGGAISDLGGNTANLTLNSVESTVGVLVDTNAPTIVLGPLTDTGSGTFTSAITLSEAASGDLFELADLTVGNGTATLTGSGTSFVATLTPVSFGSLLTLDVAAGAFTDAADIENTAAAQVSIIPDNTPPTITLGTLSDAGAGTYTSAITLSELPSGNLFEQSDLTVSNGTATLTGSGTSFTATIMPVADGIVSLDVAAAAFTDAAGNDNTAATQVSTTFDGTSPTITLGPLVNTGSGTYTAVITLSEPASGNLFEQSDLTVSNGTAILIGSGTSFTATLTPQKRGQLIELSVAAAAFTDYAGNASTATNTVSVLVDAIQEAKQLIANVMQSNARIILQNQPKIGRRLDRLAGRVYGAGSISVFGASITNSGLPIDAVIDRTGGTFSFSLTRARQVQGKLQIRANPLSLADAVGLAVTQPTSLKSSNEHFPRQRLDQDTSKPQPADKTYALINPERFPKIDDENASTEFLPRYDVWIEGTVGHQNLSDGQSDFAIVHVGADYLVTPNLLVGVGAQFDWTDYNSNSSATSSDANAIGYGFLVGPYITAKLYDPLYLDARLSFGQSYTDVSPLGTFTDNVTTDRILASAALVGEMDWNDITIRPELRANYYRDVSQAYTDSLGFTVDGVTYETGVLEFGPSFTKSFDLENGVIATPKFSFEGVWTFAERNTGATLDTRAGTGLRGRTEAGLDIATANGFNFTVSGHYDGIGDSDYEAYGGSLSISKKW